MKCFRKIATAEHDCILSKFCICFIAIFMFIVTIITAIFIVTYQAKLNHHESRITILETNFMTFMENIDENGNDKINFITYNLSTDMSLPKRESNEKDVEKQIFGIQEVKPDTNRHLQTNEVSTARIKRQIMIHQGPTMSPNVEKSKDGIPILVGSYAGSPHSSRNRNWNFSSNSGYYAIPDVKPTTDSEGLRLYESLVTISRNGNEQESRRYTESKAKENENELISKRTFQIDHYRRPELKSIDNFDLTSSLHTESNFNSHPKSTTRQMDDQSFHLDRTEPARGDVQEEISKPSSRMSSYVLPMAMRGNHLITRSSRVPSTNVQNYEQNLLMSEYPLFRNGDGQAMSRIHHEKHQETKTNETRLRKGPALDDLETAETVLEEGNYSEPGISYTHESQHRHQGDFLRKSGYILGISGRTDKDSEIIRDRQVIPLKSFQNHNPTTVSTIENPSQPRNTQFYGLARTNNNIGGLRATVNVNDNFSIYNKF